MTQVHERKYHTTHDLDWLIVGGGIHGVHIAIRLLSEGVERNRLRIIDPADRLLDRWKTCTNVTGMEYLRSPSVHNLDVPAFSLRRFARKQWKRNPGIFAFPYDRPTRKLFDAHCDALIQKHNLNDLHVRGRVQEIAVEKSFVSVKPLEHHALATRRVILAIGTSDQPHRPAWARDGHSQIRHAFDPKIGDPSFHQNSVIAVVGGGLSAAQIAIRFSHAEQRVLLISRHKIRTHQFDSDPGWLGPKYMNRFARIRDLSARRELIQEARHRGSVSPDIRTALRLAINKGQITWINAEVKSVAEQGHRLSLQLSHGQPLEVDHVLLATGFTTQRPGGKMLDNLIESARLACAPCGYPVVDTGLRWHPRIHVAGPLAELELGPSARNIAGARNAGDRIVACLRKSLAGQK